MFNMIGMFENADKQFLILFHFHPQNEFQHVFTEIITRGSYRRNIIEQEADEFPEQVEFVKRKLAQMDESKDGH